MNWQDNDHSTPNPKSQQVGAIEGKALEREFSRILFTFQERADLKVGAFLEGRIDELRARGVDARAVCIHPGDTSGLDSLDTDWLRHVPMSYDALSDALNRDNSAWLWGIDTPGIFPIAQRTNPRARLVHEVRNDDPLYLRTLLDTALLRNMVGFVVPSQSFRERIIALFPYLLPVEVVPNCLPRTDAVRTPESRLRSASNTPIILWAGALGPQHNWQAFFDIMRRLLREGDFEFWMLETPSVDSEYQVLLRTMEGLGHGDKVRVFREPTPTERRGILAEVSISGGCLVSTSWGQPFDQVLLEAMAGGCPAVVSDVPGSQDLVTDRESGWIFPPMDLDRACTLILKAVRDLEARTKVIAQAKQRTKAYTPAKVVDRLIACLDGWSEMASLRKAGIDNEQYRAAISRQTELMIALNRNAHQVAARLSNLVSTEEALKGDRVSLGTVVGSLYQTAASKDRLLTELAQRLEIEGRLSHELESELIDRRGRFRELKRELREVHQELGQAREVLEDQIAENVAITQRLEQRERHLEEMSRQRQKDQERIVDLLEDIAQQSNLIRRQEGRISEIEGSRAWRLIRFLWTIRLRMAPPGSRRGHAFSRILRGIEVWRQEGLRGVWERALILVRARTTRPLYPYWWGDAPGTEETVVKAQEFVHSQLARGPSHFVILFSAVPFLESEGQRAMWLGKELAKRDIPVLFAAWRWSPFDSLPQFEDAATRMQIPLDVLVTRAEAILSIPDMPTVPKVFVVEFPHTSLFPIVNLAEAYGWTTIYDVIDDWHEFSKVGQADWYDESFERYLLHNVNHVSATSDPLRRKALQGGAQAVKLIPNAYAGSTFGPSDEAVDLPVGEVTVGYFGHLTSSWFDWERIISLAKRRPEWLFHIIGYGGDPGDRLPSNVLMLGKIDHQQLPKYAANWDVALIPFKPGQLSRAVNPVKIYEYLALYLPVVASGMPHLAEMPYVWNAGSVEEMLRMITEAASSTVDQSTINAFLSENTWERRVDELLGLVHASTVPWPQRMIEE
jgi:glycosyltransferase involved in cell wall biosynthesis